MSHATIKNEGGRMLKEVSGFEWDAGNKQKSLVKHEVSNEECEEAFFDYKKETQKDILHSMKEERYVLIGQTKKKEIVVHHIHHKEK